MAAERDSIHRFVFEKHNVRGEIVRLNATWAAVLERHDYTAPARDLLGEALGAVALLTSILKFDGSLTLQVQGDGLLKLLVAQCTSRMTVRGLVQLDDAVDGGETLTELAGDGRLVMTIEPRGKGQRYQGIVPLEGATLAECLENYFARSEQLPTRLWLAADAGAVVGMLLQKLPEPEAATATHVHDVDAWHRLTLLAATLTHKEMHGLSDQEILHRLFHEEDVRLFDSNPVSFRCTCSRQRIGSALRGLGREEVSQIEAEQGKVTTTCEFCNKSYVFDAVDIAALFAAPSPDTPPSQH